VGLPRFEITYRKPLKDVLSDIGMAIAFDPSRADFSAMLPVSQMSNAYISQVLHETYVKVDEEGTEAAGATAVEIGLTAIPQMFRMIVDRPFFLAIRDNVTGTIVFMGAIVEPL
jgi:serine protease inhibitor